MPEVKVMKENKPFEAAVKPFEGWEFGFPMFRGSMFHLNPFALMRKFTEDMDRFFVTGNTAFPEAEMWKGDVWRPVIEMKEEGGKFFLHAELPGVTKENVKVSVMENLLTIEGERKNEKEVKEEGFFHTERRYGKFARTVRLPEGAKFEEAAANFNNGILEVTVPVAAKKVAHEVPVFEAPKAKAA